MMTTYQRGLARFALGLRKGQKVSFRNRYCAGPNNKDFKPWMDLVSQGLVVHKAPHYFHLTYNGALLALDKGDRLDGEDFHEAKVQP